MNTEYYAKTYNAVEGELFKSHYNNLKYVPWDICSPKYKVRIQF